MNADDPRTAFFTRRPDAGTRTARYDIIRATADQTLRAIILSADATGARTHYYQSRTLPCAGPTCEACAASQPSRWYGYLGVMSAQRARIAIIEITPPCCDALDEYLGRHETLRGARLEAWRKPKRPNGTLYIALTPPTDALEDLPRPPDVETTLYNMWETSWARSSVQLRPGEPGLTHEDLVARAEEKTTRRDYYATARHDGLTTAGAAATNGIAAARTRRRN